MNKWFHKINKTIFQVANNRGINIDKLLRIKLFVSFPILKNYAWSLNSVVKGVGFSASTARLR